VRTALCVPHNPRQYSPTEQAVIKRYYFLWRCPHQQPTSVAVCVASSLCMTLSRLANDWWSLRLCLSFSCLSNSCPSFSCSSMSQFCNFVRQCPQCPVLLFHVLHFHRPVNNEQTKDNRCSSTPLYIINVNYTLGFPNYASNTACWAVLALVYFMAPATVIAAAN